MRKRAPKLKHIETKRVVMKRIMTALLVVTRIIITRNWEKSELESGLEDVHVRYSAYKLHACDF